MDLMTIAGMIVAVVALLGGMYFKGVPFSNLANPAAIFIILVGTTGAILNAFPAKDLKNIGALFAKIFTDKLKFDNVETVKKFVEYAQIVRKDGILGLEATMANITDPFLLKGIDLLMTGQSATFIEDALTEEIHAMEERHRANAGIFAQGGMYAPTLGVMGAVVGLIAALANMDDTEALGHAISGAFMATVYGIFTGYILWHPFSNKLKRKSSFEVLNKQIIVEGIVLLEQGLAPDLIKETLTSYLTPKEVAQLESKGDSNG